MENKNLKPSFALFITVVLITVLFLYSYSIVESNIFQSNLNKLKYMNLQANIHFDYVKKFIEENNDEAIQKLSLNDTRFDLNIVSQKEEKVVSYYVVIQAKDDIPVRLSEVISKSN